MGVFLYLNLADAARLLDSIDLPVRSGSGDQDVTLTGAWPTSLGIIQEDEVRNAGPPRAQRAGRGREEGSAAALSHAAPRGKRAGGSR